MSSPPNRPLAAIRYAAAPRRRTAFTLIELMVVVSILALLLTVLITVASSAVTRGKIRETKAVMQNLELAIDQFHNDAPLKRVKAYKERYGTYPCDELEGFHRADSVPGSTTFIGPGAPNSDLNYPGNAPVIDVSHQSIKAMALSIRLYSPEATAILDQISPRYRVPADQPEEFFDRNINGNLDTDDEPLGYFVDAWGKPFEYFALNPTNANPQAAPSDTTQNEQQPQNGARLNASPQLIAANRGRPLLLSYGPDGPDQFSSDFINTEGHTFMVWDFDDDGLVNHRLNADNVYTEDSIKERLNPKTD